MKKSYQIQYPSKIIFGAGRMSELPSLIPHGSRILLLTGAHAQKDGLQKKLIELLNGFYTIPLAGVTPEPPLEEVDRLLEIGRREKISAIVAVGGGSVIDTAKTAAALIPEDGLTTDYFEGRRKITKKGLFFAALPTTAGTGAEITPNSVLTDLKSKVKKSIRHSTMFADLALIDPELTCSASPELTAASGLDALTQAIESYISTGANAVSRALAADAVRKMMHSLPLVYKTPSDIIHRTEAAEGSMLSAMAFSQSGLGAVHGLAHPIGSMLKIAHGLSCAVLLLPVLKWNKAVCEKEYSELASFCGLKDADSFIAAIESLCGYMNIPSNFVPHGLKVENFGFILENCRSNSMKSNPRYMEDGDILDLLKSLI